METLKFGDEVRLVSPRLINRSARREDFISVGKTTLDPSTREGTFRDQLTQLSAL
jgi:hypothetical protein